MKMVAESTLIVIASMMVGAFMATSCMRYRKVQYPADPCPPVKNTCDCKCDCEEVTPGVHNYEMVMPEGNCGVTVCCSGCGLEENGRLFCK